MSRYRRPEDDSAWWGPLLDHAEDLGWWLVHAAGTVVTVTVCALLVARVVAREALRYRRRSRP